MRYALRHDGLDQLYGTIRRRGFWLAGPVLPTGKPISEGQIKREIERRARS